MSIDISKGTEANDGRRSGSICGGGLKKRIFLTIEHKNKEEGEH